VRAGCNRLRQFELAGLGRYLGCERDAKRGVGPEVLANLAEDQRFLDHREAEPAGILGQGHTEPALLGQFDTQGGVEAALVILAEPLERESAFQVVGSGVDDLLLVAVGFKVHECFLYTRN
jgi:hypothetical protein